MGCKSLGIKLLRRSGRHYNVGLMLMGAIVAFAATCVSHKIEKQGKGVLPAAVGDDWRHPRCVRVARSLLLFIFFHETRPSADVYHDWRVGTR